MTVTGTVAYIRDEDDGDVHVDLAVPASEAGLLDAANRTRQDGQLVTEIVPADQPGCTPGRPPRPASGTYSYGVCTGADLVTPPLGSQVTVTGPYVLDADHGWMEIHPVWAITVVGRSAVGAPAATTVAGALAWCRASAAPSADGYSGDYDVFIHSNQPDTEATATDAGDTWSHPTDGSGYADVRLWHTSPGEHISVTVGTASCSATA